MVLVYGNLIKLIFQKILDVNCNIYRKNMKLGQTIDIVLSGTLSSAAITLATNFSSTTIRRIGTTELDTSATNVITVICIDDTDNAAIVHYTINTFQTDTTP